MKAYPHRIGTFLALLLVLVFSGSCDKNPTEAGDSLLGQWRVVSYSYELRFNGVTQEDYSETISYINEIHSIVIFVITEDFFSVFENNPCSDGFYSSSSSYTTTEDTITMDEETWQYSFESGQLILEIEYVETVEGVEVREVVTTRLTPYKGQVPPSEWGAAITNDSYEPDNGAAEATAITVDAAAQNHVLINDDVDWFNFTAAQGETYVIETTGNLDTVIQLYGVDGVTPITGAYDDDSGTSYNARLEWTAPANGGFYFTVCGYDDEECGVYAISVVK